MLDFTQDEFTSGLTIYMVGGAVRDVVLGRPFTERDWVVVGSSADDLIKRGFKQVAKFFPVFIHPVTGEEYALARTERCIGQRHRDFSCNTEVVTLEEDLLRRDFTMNSLAMNAQGDIIDCHGGRSDIKNRIIRHVSDAFSEDPLRIFRLARFYAVLKFDVDPSTQALVENMIKNNQHRNIAQERITKELDKSGASISRMIEFLARISLPHIEVHDSQLVSLAKIPTDFLRDMRFAVCLYFVPTLIHYLTMTSYGHKIYKVIKRFSQLKSSEDILNFILSCKGIQSQYMLLQHCTDIMSFIHGSFSPIDIIKARDYIVLHAIKDIRSYPTAKRQQVIRRHQLSLIESLLAR